MTFPSKWHWRFDSYFIGKNKLCNHTLPWEDRELQFYKACESLKKEKYIGQQD